MASNLSAGGMGLKGLTTTLIPDCGLRVRFQLPESDTTVEALARLAWVGMQGHAGIAFTDVKATTREEIRSWLDQRMMREGWAVPLEESGDRRMESFWMGSPRT